HRQRREPFGRTQAAGTRRPVHLGGSRVLRQCAARVAAVDDLVRRVADDRLETGRAGRGRGLAGNEGGGAGRRAGGGVGGGGPPPVTCGWSCSELRSSRPRRPTPAWERGSAWSPWSPGPTSRTGARAPTPSPPP